MIEDPTATAPVHVGESDAEEVDRRVSRVIEMRSAAGLDPVTPAEYDKLVCREQEFVWLLKSRHAA